MYNDTLREIQQHEQWTNQRRNFNDQNTKNIYWIFFYHAEDKTNFGHIGLRGKTGFGVKGLQMEFTDL